MSFHWQSLGIPCDKDPFQALKRGKGSRRHCWLAFHLREKKAYACSQLTRKKRFLKHNISKINASAIIQIMDNCVETIQGDGRKLSYKRHSISIPSSVPI